MKLFGYPMDLLQSHLFTDTVVNKPVNLYLKNGVEVMAHTKWDLHTVKRDETPFVIKHCKHNLMKHLCSECKGGEG